jgi:hypothetical protein
MRNAESIRRRLDEVKNMKDQQEALCSLADIQFEIGMSACEERSKLQKEIDNLRRIISGNGDPDHSLMSRMSGMEKCVGEMGDDIKTVKNALLGSLEDGDVTGGILGRIKDAEKVNANITRIMWIILGAAVAQIVATILGII